MNAAQTQEVAQASFGKLNDLDGRMPSVCERLDSWKEIAAYFRRSVRCVQRWEKNERLPVFRHWHAHGATVYANRQELGDWWHGRGGKL